MGIKIKIKKIIDKVRRRPAVNPKDRPVTGPGGPASGRIWKN